MGGGGGGGAGFRVRSQIIVGLTQRGHRKQRLRRAETQLSKYMGTERRSGTLWIRYMRTKRRSETLLIRYKITGEEQRHSGSDTCTITGEEQRHSGANTRVQREGQRHS